MEGQIQSSRKRARDDDPDELRELDSAVVKRLRDDLLGVCDDSGLDSAGRDLDSVMRSFQDEISAPSTSITSPPVVIDLTSDSSESQSELGYLLGASDGELGLPPSTAASVKEAAELARVPSYLSGIGDLWGFETFYDQIPSYDFEYGGAIEDPEGEYAVAFDDGLFRFSDGCFDPSEVSGFTW